MLTSRDENRTKVDGLSLLLSTTATKHGQDEQDQQDSSE
jgi:hypothetical protein